MKTYVIKKVVKAKNISQALRKERDAEINEIYQTRSREDTHELPPAIGFGAEPPEDEDDF